MRYHHPMTPQQRRRAMIEYRSYRRSLARVRSTHPPRIPPEAKLLRDYHDAVRAFGLEAKKSIFAIDATTLNRLQQDAVTAMLAYFARRAEGGWFS
jgi:hypothetical protein